MYHPANIQGDFCPSQEGPSPEGYVGRQLAMGLNGQGPGSYTLLPDRDYTLIARLLPGKETSTYRTRGDSLSTLTQLPRAYAGVTSTSTTLSPAQYGARGERASSTIDYRGL